MQHNITISLSLDELKSIVEDSVKNAISTLPHQKSILPTKSKLLSKKDLAEKLGISIATVNRRMVDGSFPFSKIEGRVLFNEVDIDKVLGISSASLKKVD